MSFVYFIECDGFIKVGLAKDIASRLSMMQVGCPHTMALVGFIPGGRETERGLHKQLAEFHHRGEWFTGEGVFLAVSAILEEDDEQMRLSHAKRAKVLRQINEGLPLYSAFRT